jgi:hypothetical protein
VVPSRANRALVSRSAGAALNGRKCAILGLASALTRKGVLPTALAQPPETPSAVTPLPRQTVFALKSLRQWSKWACRRSDMSLIQARPCDNPIAILFEMRSQKNNES